MAPLIRHQLITTVTDHDSPPLPQGPHKEDGTMSSRLNQILSHINPFSSADQPQHPPWFHPLNPTYFLPRAASIYGSAQAVQHRTSANIDITRTYSEFSSRAAGLSYFLREEMKLKRGDRVAIVSPNTPMFLESLFGIAGAGCISLCVNYKLTSQGILPIYRVEGRNMLDFGVC
jgi:AMP-binding enzyme